MVGGLPFAEIDEGTPPVGLQPELPTFRELAAQQRRQQQETFEGALGASGGWAAIASPVTPEPKPPEQLPTFRELAAQRQQQQEANVAGLDAASGWSPKPQPMAGEVWDTYFSHGPAAAVLNAVGAGFRQGFGAEPIGLEGGQEHVVGQVGDALRKVGILEDVERSGASIMQGYNEAILRPLAATIDAGFRTALGAFSGTQAGLRQLGIEAGQPALGRDMAGMLEYRMGSPGHLATGVVAPPLSAGVRHLLSRPELSNIPAVPVVPGGPTWQEAYSFGVIGQGEAGYFGLPRWQPTVEGITAQQIEVMRAEVSTARERAPPPEERALTPPPIEAPHAPPPTVHEVAREIAPAVFEPYDAAAAQRTLLRDRLQLAREERHQAVEAAAPHTAEITALEARMEDATPRLQKKYEDRLEVMRAERDAWLADEENTRPILADTEDMARDRRLLLESDIQMRDLAPQVSAAYREAQGRMPPVVEPEVAPEPARPVKRPVAAEPVVVAPPILQDALRSAERPVNIAGMEGERAPDPIARDILKRPEADLRELEAVLASRGVRELHVAGAGSTSIVLDAGDGRVVRLGLGGSRARPNIPEVLQPIEVGRAGGIGYEILPKVDVAGIVAADVEAMKASLAARGFRFSDPGTDNLGRTPDGRLVVTDSGAISREPGTAAPAAEPARAAVPHPEAADAVTVLRSLGFKAAEARAAVDRASRTVGPEAPIAELVRAAIQEAARPVPERVAPPAEAAAPAPARAALPPVTETVQQISERRAQMLVAAGRPLAEAQASTALEAAHYQARAARFEGRLGTAAELYSREAPEIRAARGPIEAPRAEPEPAAAPVAQPRIRSISDIQRENNVSAAAAARIQGEEIVARSEWQAAQAREMAQGRTLEQPVPFDETKRVDQPIQAFHGSPHLFEEFDLDKIGTGEGAQVYGHGLYFAGNEAVARYYRENLRGEPHTTIGGVRVHEAVARMAAEVERRREIQVEDRAAFMEEVRRDLQNYTMLLQRTAERLKNADDIRVMRDAQIDGWLDISRRDLARYGRDYDRAQVAALEAIRDFGPVEYVEPKGRLFHTNLHFEPEKLLDWDKPISGQSEAVRSFFDGVPGIDPSMTGAEVYRFLGRGQEQMLSAQMERAGIPGIRYLDAMSRHEGTGTHNYVVFDPARVEVREYEQPARGNIRLQNDRATITLMGRADASTFIHETGHNWLEELRRDARHEQAPQGVLDDWATVRRWLDVGEDGNIPRRAHEKFARGFERYMMEGTAPSSALARVFQQFKTWLTDIYKTVAALRAPITADIRGVFDRMLAEEPQPHVVAPERAEAPPLEPTALPSREASARTATDMARVHEADVAETPAAEAAGVADHIGAEFDRTVREHAPEIADELERRTGETGQGPEGTGGVAGDGTRGPAPPGDGGGAGAVEGGGGGIAPEGGGVRTAEPITSGAALAGNARGASTPAKPTSLYERVGKEPTRLASYIRALGGIRDEGGDIAHILGGSKYRPGLINERGLPADEVALRLWEAGYFPGDVRPDINTLLMAIEEDVKHTPRYSEFDADAVRAYSEARENNAEIDRLAAQFDITTKGLSREKFFDRVAERMSTTEIREEISNEISALGMQFAIAERGAESLHGLTESPEALYGAARTLEDLEREHQSRSSAPAAPPGEPVGERPGSTAPVEGGGAEGGGTRGRGSGADGRPIEEGAIPPAELSGEPLLDKAGNIRLDLINSEEAFKQALRESAERNGDFMEERRGVVPVEMSFAIADTLGLTPNDVATRRIGEAYNDSQIIRVLGFVRQASADVKEKSATFAISGAPADLAAMKVAEARFDLMAGQLAGITAEAGRALNIFKYYGDTIKDAKQLSFLIADHTGESFNQALRRAKAVAALETTEQVAKATRQREGGFVSGFMNGLLEFYINNLISGPATHTTYMIANHALSLWHVPETAIAGVLGRILPRPTRAVEGLPIEGGGGLAERVYFGEAHSRVFGIVDGFPDALVAGWKALKSGVTEVLPGENPATARMASMGLLPKRVPDPILMGIKVPLGTLINLPSRGVTAIHSYTRAYGFSETTSALAWRQAASEGLTGNEFYVRLNQLKENPTAEMNAMASGEATVAAMMGAGGPISHAISQLVNTRFHGVPAGKFLLPFVHVGANVVSEGLLQRTPIGIFVDSTVRANLAGRNGGAARDIQIAKIALGSALSATVMSLALQGTITGAAPSEGGHRAVWLKQHPENSIRVGDFWYSYGRLGSLGLIMASVADLMQIIHGVGEGEHSKNMVGAIILAASHAVLDETWMRGAKDVVEALADHTGNAGQRFVQNFVSSLSVPYSVGLGQIDRQIDPYSRQAHSIWQAMVGKIPFASESLLPRIDIFGQPIANRPAAGVPGLSAIYKQAANTDATVDALARLRIFPAMPGKKLNGIELTEAEYQDLSIHRGTLMKSLMDNAVMTPGFNILLPGMQFKMLHDAQTAATRSAHQYMLLRYPHLIADAYMQKMEQLTVGKKPH